MEANQVTQENNTIGQDLAGRDIDKSNHIHFNSSENRSSKIKELFKKFKYEKENNIQFSEIIEELDRFSKPKSGPVIGLEAKLIAANRESFLEYAIEVKEFYTKKLYKYQFYESAQNINIYLLALVRTYFMNYVYPLIYNGESSETVNIMVGEKIINPLLEELDGDTLGFSSEDIEGMIYFLTGNCYIKWTK